MLKKRLLYGLVVAWSLLPQVAYASWWNEEWTGRKLLQIDASPTGANIVEPIGPVPLLVRLYAGNFDFSVTKPDGSDLRFIASDDKTPLKHHIEKFDSLLGEALIWVALQEIQQGAKTDLWMYYGNPKAIAIDDAKGTYDAATTLVYHFEERGQIPKDSSTWGNHAVSLAAGTDALIGSGLRLDGRTTVGIPAGASLAWVAGGAMTWSAWIRTEDADADGIIFSRRDGDHAFVLGVQHGKPFVGLEGTSRPLRGEATEALSAKSWHHLGVAAGSTLTLYVDGAPVATIAAPLPAFDSPSVIGGLPDEEESEPTDSATGIPARPRFKGEIDELTMAKVERPAGFFRAVFAGQGTDASRFLTAGQGEETSSRSGGYFGVILRSVTLDGWVVIGLLAIMGAISWLVMVSKASYLSAVERANELFVEEFRRMGPDLLRVMAANNGASALGEEATRRNSSLFRIFWIASEEVRRRSGAGKALSSEAIEAIRASMDAGLVRENQRLTSRVVFLTIAISGGPFLGLLGTVVGVMITFAAIAAAGDVNVNAIAPGIAAALVATVAGLAVAIPALFGYNWLLTRIKNVTATMQVFVDELVTKVAEAHATHGPWATGGELGLFEATPPPLPTAICLQD